MKDSSSSKGCHSVAPDAQQSELWVGAWQSSRATRKAEQQRHKAVLGMFRGPKTAYNCFRQL
eukprot:857470-Alexandrium_andersonii.AAC.1